MKALTDSIIAALEADGLVVFDGEAPASAGWAGTPGQSSFVGYCVVHPILGGIVDGTIGDPYGMSEVLYQVSCYGATRGQCEQVTEQALAVVLAHRPTTIDGVSIRHVDDDMLGGARRVDDLQPPIWQAVPRFRFYTDSTTTSNAS